MQQLNVHREVTPDGWKLDRDHWYTRKMRDGDVTFDNCMIGFTHRRRVYVRTAAQCGQYDRGEVKAGDN
ncbi:hypothetical protein [Bradyrhizobium sp. HKCCYLS20291]|uniref:hypothetical protein n=1 Tax=Bradyrhizobium sp. HKCCYLS20291 TaxID=3420766 RepID=UPI003EB9FFA9